MPTTLAVADQSAPKTNAFTFDSPDFATRFSEWLRDLIAVESPDLLVAVARGAVRLVQIVAPDIAQQPTFVSNHAIPFLKDSELEGKHVLLIDDSVIFGSSLHEVYRYLLSRGATVRCAAFAIDRRNFLGEIPQGSTISGFRSPFADLPIRSACQLFPEHIREHHASIVRNVASNPLDYNLDFPTFAIPIPSISVEEVPFVSGLLGLHSQIETVIDVTSPWSANANIYRFTAFFRCGIISPFTDAVATIRRLTKLRVLIAPKFKQILVTPIVQLRAAEHLQMEDVKFHDVIADQYWNSLDLSAGSSDQHYSRSVLRLLTCFVSTLLAKDCVRLVRQSLEPYFPCGPAHVEPFDLNVILGRRNGAIISALLSSDAPLKTLLDASANVSYTLFDDDVVNTNLQSRIVGAIQRNPQFVVGSSDSIAEALGKLFLALREATDSESERRKVPSAERLEVGLTPRDIDALLRLFGRNDSAVELSAGLDLCVDNGLAVPKVIACDGQMLRAFYCGEDEDDQGTHQLRACLDVSYREHLQRNPNGHLSPFDFQKLCTYLKEVMPWLPITSRFENYGRTAYVHNVNLIDWLIDEASGSMIRERRPQRGGALLLPRPDFRSPLQGTTWQEQKVRDFQDGFDFVAKVFSKLTTSDEAKLLISTCPTHRHTYNAVAFELYQWCHHPLRSFDKAIDAVSRALQNGDCPSESQLTPLFWCIQYLTEVRKKRSVFYQKFETLKRRLAIAFERQGSAAYRWWQLSGSRHLDPEQDPLVEQHFQPLMRLFALSSHLTAHLASIVCAVDPRAKKRLEKVFYENGFDLSSRSYYWLTEATEEACCKGYSRHADAFSKDLFQLNSRITNTSVAAAVGGAHHYRLATEALTKARDCFEEIRNVSGIHLTEYRVSDGEFPFLPKADKRRRVDGSTEVICRSSYFFIMDVIGSTNSPKACEFMQAAELILKKFRKISNRFHWQVDSGDRFKAVDSDIKLLFVLAERLDLEALHHRADADGFLGIRKAIGFGHYRVVQSASETQILDAEIPQTIPHASSLLDIIDQLYAGHSRREVLALTADAFNAAKTAGALNNQTELHAPSAKGKHYAGVCHFIAAPKSGEGLS